MPVMPSGTTAPTDAAYRAIFDTPVLQGSGSFADFWHATIQKECDHVDSTRIISCFISSEGVGAGTIDVPDSAEEDSGEEKDGTAPADTGEETATQHPGLSEENRSHIELMQGFTLGSGAAAVMRDLGAEDVIILALLTLSLFCR